MGETTGTAEPRILVTGATGFIGSHLVRRLLQDSAGEIHAVSRQGHAEAGDGVRWWQVDLADPESVQGLVAGIRPHLVFHLASAVVGARDRDLVIPTFRSNLMSTVNLLTAAAEVGCRRVILCGSQEEPDPRDSTGIPSSPYAAAKWAGGAYARMFHALYGLPVVILRIFMVYGPAQRDLRKLVPYVICSLLQGEPPRLTSGDRPIDWVYVDDVVDGFLAAAQTAGVEGRTIDIGSGSLTPIRTVVEHLVGLVNPRVVPQFGALPDRPFEQVRAADTATSLDTLGWRPRVSLGEGLRQTVGWYERQFQGAPR
jgi:UDP-glucose 4-epimerase